jgi:hypothetical protein
MPAFSGHLMVTMQWLSVVVRANILKISDVQSRGRPSAAPSAPGLPEEWLECLRRPAKVQHTSKQCLPYLANTNQNESPTVRVPQLIQQMLASRVTRACLGMAWWPAAPAARPLVSDPSSLSNLLRLTNNVVVRQFSSGEGIAFAKCAAQAWTSNEVHGHRPGWQVRRCPVVHRVHAISSCRKAGTIMSWSSIRFVPRAYRSALHACCCQCGHIQHVGHTVLKCTRMRYQRYNFHEMFQKPSKKKVPIPQWRVSFSTPHSTPPHPCFRSKFQHY